MCFQNGYKEERKMINYFSLFSGIGAFEKAMTNLNIPFNLVGFSEIDKYASKSYCAIHNVSESLNFGDITKIDETKLPKIDFITYGFPCQDISLAGHQKGLFNADGTKTRSGLFFDALRIIEHTQPMVAIAENVKNLIGKKFNAQFQVVLASLEAAGYNNYWAVLNAKDYGIPQNRERVFIVSIRKDCDTGVFEFPEAYPLKLRLKDMLDVEVDEKFYLSDIQVQKLQLKSADALVYDKSMIGFEGNAREYTDVMPTITSREWKEPRVVNESKLTELNTDKVMQIGNCRPTKNRANPNQGRIYDTNGISPCLNTSGGGNREPHIVEPTIQKVFDIPKEVLNDNERQRRVYSPEGISPTLLNRSDSPKTIVAEPVILEDFYKNRDERIYKDVAPTLRGERSGLKVVEPKVIGGIGEKKSNGGQQWYQQDRIYDGEKVAISVTTNFNPYYSTHDLRIRKLTPKECFRLMGFCDEDFAKAEMVNSNTQLYKQAGNSIVVDVAEELLCMLFDEEGKFFV